MHQTITLNQGLHYMPIFKIFWVINFRLKFDHFCLATAHGFLQNLEISIFDPENAVFY